MSSGYESVNNVLSRLDDPYAERYARADVLKALEEGEDVLLRRTEALWDAEFYDSAARAGNITARWEQVYLIPLTQATFYCGLINYTGGHWEREYLGPEVFHNGATGPVQVTAPWEALHQYHPEAIDIEVVEVPERLVRVDRVGWGHMDLDPQTGNSMRRFYGNFRDHQGSSPRFFIFNEDGLRSLRVSPTMPNTGTLYTYEGSRGLLRNDYYADLEHAWSLDEASGSSREDSVGSYTLSESGGVVASETGQLDDAATLVAADNAILLGPETETIPEGPMTISFWFKPGATNGTTQIMVSWMVTGGQKLQISMPNARTSISSFISSDGSNGSTMTTSVTVSVGSWYLCKLTRTAHNKWKMGIWNGSAWAQSSTQPTVILTDTVRALAIGGTGSAGTRSNVTVDSLKIWKGVLTDADTLARQSGAEDVPVLADESAFDDITYSGTRGILRTTDNHIQVGSLRGHPVRLHSDTGNLRIEFFRLGHDLTEGGDIELPERFVRAIEDSACARLLADEGPGQDITLSAFYSARFETAVERVRKRVNQMRQQRTAAFGTNTGRISTPYARLPQSYPEGS